MIRKILLSESDREMTGYSCLMFQNPQARSTAVARLETPEVSFDNTEGGNSPTREGDLDRYRDIFPNLGNGQLLYYSM